MRGQGPRPPERARRLVAQSALAGLLAGLLALPAQAQAQDQPAATGAEPSAAALAPVAAHYRVSIGTPGGKGPRQSRHFDLYFYRQADRVALIQGAVEDLWWREPAGGLRFERVFHADSRVIDYSAGELATLGIAGDAATWRALSGFIDLDGLTATPATAGRLRYRGTARGQQVDLVWAPESGLPLRLLQRGADGRVVRHELIASAPAPLAGWPLPGARSAGYLHTDAADFGDMAYDPVVRKAEALDVRAGWRQAHAHE